MKFSLLLLASASLAAARGLRESASHGMVQDLVSVPEVDKCTTIIVGPKAGLEGPMTTHTADCSDCDFRVNKVPARDWPEGTQRPLYVYHGQYPSVVTKDRGATWHPDNLEGSPEQRAAWGQESTVVGHVPQVAHTFALFEGGYGIMNEHQVAMGESTCAAKFYAKPVTAGGAARIEVSEMSKIALERSTTARQAIQIMGDLAVELGFYAADWSGGDMSKGEGGEALTVIDKNEAWVFHVLADDTGTSAVWAAQRLEEDHVAVVANSFIIRKIDPASGSFMFSDNIFQVAERAGLYKPSDGLLDFLPTFGPMRAHSEYSTRRVWRIFSLVAPSLDLPGKTDYYGNDYPFSVKTEKLLTALDLMDLQRDHYEGTEFDLTQGLAAGPYGDPARWDISPPANMSMQQILSGGFERSISMFRTSYSFVALARPVPDQLALLWFGTYNPASCSYAPFYVAADHVPAAYTRGSLFQYDPSSAFWNFLAAGNYAGRFYKHAMVEVRLLQDRLHTDMLLALGTLEKSLLASLAADPYETSSRGGGQQAMVDRLTDFTNFHGNMVVNEWRNLLPRLITKYHDGYIATSLQAPTIVMQKIFYPLWWLKAVGYFEENKGNFGPGVILFGPGPGTAGEGGLGGDGGFTAALLSAALLSSLLTMLLTVCYMQNRYKAQTQGYTTIECA